MIMEHTFSPWEIEVIQDPEQTVALIRAPKAGDELVATVYTAADAALIAEAPELLKALQAFVDYHESDYEELPETNQARAAISKAMGEPS